MESVPGVPNNPDKPRNPSTSSRKVSDSNPKQSLEESMDLFAKDDQALQKISTPTNDQRTRRDSGKSEAELRQYYKSRFRENSKSVDSEKRASLDVSGSSQRNNSVDIVASKLKQSSKASSSPKSRRSPQVGVSSNPSSPAISRVSRVSKTSSTLTVDTPPPTNSLAAELLEGDPKNTLVAGSSSPQQQASFYTHSSSTTSQDDTASMEVFTDDDGEELQQTSTPLKVPVSNDDESDQHFMWVAPDTNWYVYMYLYSMGIDINLCTYSIVYIYMTQLI